MPVSFIPFVFPGVDNVRCAFQTRWQAAGDGPYAGGNISLATADDRQRFVILTAPHKYTDFGCADINRAYNITSFKHGKIKPRNVT